MLALYLFYPFEVGNGARYLEDTTVGTGRETESFHGLAQHVEAGIIGFCKLVDHPFRHLGIAVNAFKIMKTLLLNLTGLDDALADDGARLTRLHLRQLFEGHYRHFAMDIYTIE